MKLSFPAGTVTDKSGNSSIAKTITIGIDNPTTGDGHNQGIIVDVVVPVWKAENVKTDTTKEVVTVDLIATDKYFSSVSNSTLKTSDITITVDGTANDKITKSLSTPTLSYNSSLGKSEIKYTLTLSNWKEASKQTGKSYYEYSGTTKITIAAGTVKDDTSSSTDGKSDGKSNLSKKQTFDLGILDVVKPQIELQKDSTTVNVKSQTAQLYFNVSDKYLKSSSTIANSSIKVYVNGAESSSVTKTFARNSSGDISATVNGTTRVVSQQYSLKLSGFSQSANQVKIKIPAGTVVDDYGNGNKDTELIVYNVLKNTAEEDDVRSGLLGNTSIQRQNINSIIFVNSITTLKTYRSWDVSAQQDNSIQAWTFDDATIYIGSNYEMFGNLDSSYLFSYIGYSSKCNSQETIQNIKYLNVSNVTNMSYMFRGAGYNAMKLLKLGDNFDTSNVTAMEAMFRDCGYTAMTSFDLGEKFNTSNVTNMSYLFERCGYKKMTSLDLKTKFNTSKATNMEGMFYNCGNDKMTSLNLRDNFDTSSVTNMAFMFAGCGSGAMTSLSLGSKFNTSNVTKMQYMFWETGRSAMKSLSLGSQFNTSKVTDMSSMFYSCGYTAMTSLNLGNKFNTSNVTNMSSMFYECGITAMTTLDLGPAFTKIANSFKDMFTNCGKSGAVINAPESIYKNRTSFKRSSTDTSVRAGEIAVSSGRTVNPKYRPEWTVTGTTVDKTAKSLKINIKGAVNTSNYTSNVTTALKASDISIWIDGKQLTGVSTAVSTANPTTAASITHTITITNFEEATKQSGKSYKEWSGNITLKIGGRAEATSTYSKNVLKDAYGNQSMSAIDSSGTWVEVSFKDTTSSSTNTSGKLFADVVSPSIIYEYANTTIDHGNKKVTIIFDITDKYFSSSSLTVNDITIKLGGTIATNATKTITKKEDIKATIDGKANTKVGEKYTLEVTNLDRGQGGDYSGIMTLEFKAGVATDLSSNGNVNKIITIGIDDPTNNDHNHNSGVIVDVVSPTWKIENFVYDTTNKKVTVDLIVTDKYLTGTSNSTLTTNNITLKVDGDSNANTVISKSLSTPTYSTNSTTGLKEIKYTLTLTNWEQGSKQSGKNFLEYSGTTTITIAAGVVTDKYTNKSKEQTLTVGHVDFIKPRIEKVSSTRDASAKTETIVFNVIDKYLDTSDPVADSEIKVYVDKEEASSISKTLTRVTANDVSATVNGKSQVVLQQYKLVLSGFEKSRSSIDNYRNFTDWSGTVSIDIAAGAVKDQTKTVTTSVGTASSVIQTGHNTNDKTTINADFVDFIQPKVTYKYATSDINYNTKTFTMAIDITDKYINSITRITNDNFASYLTIKIDGVDITNNSKVTKKIIETSNITAGTTSKPINKTVDGVVKTGLTNQLVGMRYKLELSNLEQAINVADYKDYSGVITVAVKAGVVADTGPTGDKTNGLSNVATTITSGVNIPGGTGSGTVVDVVDPIWERSGKSTTEPLKKTASLVIRGTDKYLASCTLTKDKIKVVVNDVVQTSGITVNLVEDTSVTLAYGKQYKVTITGFDSNAYQVKMIIPAGTLTDKSGNTNKETEFLLYSCLMKTNTETSATSAFLGNTAVQRQKVEKIILQESLSGANSTRWDVSAQQDGSIIAWYTKKSNGTFTVYIGSYTGINANKDSSYLFAHIGYDSSCAVTGNTGATDGTQKALIENLELLNVGSVTNMNHMFYNFGHKTMKSLNLGAAFDTTNVTNMNNMFEGCGYTTMTSLNLGSSFNTSAVTSMTAMFKTSGYTAMTSITLGSKFNTSNVTGMSQMFYQAGRQKLKTLNLGSSFNTSKVTNMSGMFNWMGALTSLNLGSNFDTSNVTNMSSMFWGLGYSSMTSFSLGDKFNTSKVTNMNSMFYDMGGAALTTLNLGSKFYTTSATDMTKMFYQTGKGAMTTLNLGPAFTKIANTNTDMFTNCGKSGAVINAPESIYKNRTSFKKASTDTSTAAGAIAVSSGRTVNPKYRPGWTVTGTTIDTTNKKITITIKGAVNTSDYTSNVTTALTNDSISVWIDGTELKGVTKTTSAANPATGASVTHTITITKFEETTRRSGKNYLEWSGNIALRIGGRGEATSTYSKNVLVDAYGNQSMSALDSSGTWINVDLKDATTSSANTSGKLFADFIKPEFTYEYANTTIDHGNKKVTIIFSVADKYFNTSKLTSDTTASNITVTVGGKTVANDGSTQRKKLTKTDITATIDGKASTKVGETYTLELTNLDQGGGGDYSGIVKLAFAEGVVTDKSNNKSIATTITIGVDTPTTGDGHTSGVIVDVVSPVWKVQNININKSSKTVTAELIATDKYLTGTANSTLTINNITVTVDGDSSANSNTNNPIKKSLSAASFSTNSTTGLKEIKYTLTLSNWEESSKRSGKTFLEWSGTTKITIAAGVVTDQYTNKSKAQTFTLGHVDFIKPRIEKVSSTRDASAKTETIVFNVIDKYLDTSDLVTKSEISVYVDGENASTLTKKLTRVTANDVSAIINGSSQVVSQQYQLVLSNFEKARNAKNYKDWSGTVRIDIAAGAVKDKTSVGSVNTSDAKQIAGDFVDFIKPDLKYVHQSSDINKSGKSYTMTFSITDKYYTSGKLGINDLTIKMQNGQKDSRGNEIIYNLKNEPVNISLQAAEIRAANVPNTSTSGTIQTTSNFLIGHTYTLTISNLEQLEVKTGLKTANYSGIITVAVAGNKVLDRGPAGNNTSANGNAATTITSGVNIPGGTSPTDAKVVDVVAPIWQKISSSANAIDPSNTTSSTATIVFKGTDSYYASNSLTANKIKVLVNGTEVTSGITKTLSTATELKEERKDFGKTTTTTKQYGVQYTLTVKGFTQGANQVKIQIPAGTLTDESGNTNKVTEMIIYNVLRSAESETANTSGFLGNTSIQRQNIENITFESSIPSTVYNSSTGSYVKSTAWDVSAKQDKSIIAWYETGSATGILKVHIGSNSEIFANQNSSYLFSYIGYASGCKATTTITNINLLNISGTTNMFRTFRYTGYTAMTTLNLGTNFNTQNVTNMMAMFEQTGYKAMTTFDLGSNFSTAKATTTEYMFSGWGHDKMASLNLGSKFDTSNVTKMKYMFYAAGYSSMKTLTLGSNFNTAKVTDMSYMFSNTGRTAMTSLDLGSKFNTSAVTNMAHMFDTTGYTAMTSLRLGDNFNTSNVENMQYMFNSTGYTAMTSLDLGNQFYTSKVTNMNYMFNGCGHTAMKALDLGPAFTNVASANTNFMTNCGASGLAIYAPESIYSNKKAFYIK